LLAAIDILPFIEFAVAFVDTVDSC